MKGAFTLIEVLIVVSVMVIIVAFLWPVFVRSEPIAPRFSCQANLKQIGLGFLEYVQDYEGMLPSDRASSSTGWVDVLQPYTKSTQLFQCPAGNGKTESSSDYFYNRRVVHMAQNKIERPALTIVFGDGEDNAPTWSSWMGLPAGAATNSDSPSQRHRGTANYLFADGHVKSYRPGAISSTFAAPTSRPTFAFR